MLQNQSQKRIKKRYITGLDGMRTIGVIGVILYHLNPGLFKGGFLGVPIFMVISGYLITDHLLLDVKRTGHFNFKNFWKRRLKRLYPTLITMLLGTSAYIVLFQRSLLYNLHKIFLSNLAYVYNWWEIANGQSYFERFANNESPFTHLWTLSIEGQFYLVWPLLIMLLLHFKQKRSTIFGVTMFLGIFSAVLMAVLYQPGVDPSRVYYGTDTRMFSLLFGSGLALVWPSNRLKARVAKVDRLFLDALGAVALGGMVIMLLTSDAQSDFLYRGGMVIFSLLTVVLTAVVAHPGADWDQILSNHVFSWFGSRSYGIYLYQFPVMIFFETHFTDIADHRILYPVVEVLIILVISELSYRFVERTTGRFDFKQTGNWLRWLFSRRTGVKGWQHRIIALILLLILGTGATGVVQAVGVRSDPADHSEVADKIEENKKKTSKQNQALVDKIQASKSSSKKAKSESIAQSVKAESDRSLSESISQSKSASSSSEAAEIAKDPANADLIKKGLSVSELSLAKTLPITAIGDSVMLGSAEGYKRIFPNMYIDAAVSRQSYSVPGIVDGIVAKGALSDVVLIGMGTNGSFTDAQLAAIMTKLGQRQVFWINVYVPTRPWQNTVNNELAVGAKKYPNLHVIDWYSYAKVHPDWFSGDHVHPNPTGSPYYTAFVAKSVLSELEKN
ncbi:acyltransferase family protein [Lapidilactobacillus mulanensis]|uniref:Acyltransferase family protein n=1 Tax=Lapidilactobacillus mulanensis TaxID=2485999 RepID=A0ABW4DPG3_9LACO|nr:acyltransferase family protein [Lapidilactobacillus mulanensis]